jgi:hypothetical protein
MAWKNLKQLSLADSLTSEHEALTELDDINELMVREAVLEGDVMAKRAGILAESRFVCPFLEYQLFFKAHVIEEH